VLQEVANARVAMVVCGSKSISTRTFALVPSLLELQVDHHCQAVLDIMPAPSRKESCWSQKRDLHTLLVKFRGSKGTDPRDMVYVMLGMSSDAVECYAQITQKICSKLFGILPSSYCLT
jgi:hypothetical protein